MKEMFLFLALFILAATRSMCKGQHENNCKVVPEDPYIEVGSDTEIVCQTSCVSGKIFWTLNSRRIDESQSSAVNSSHTVLTLRNVTLQRATLECRSANNHLVLGGTTIQTYSKPSNISCILDHKDQPSDEELSLEPSPDWFTCNWQHKIDPKQKINYTVLYDSPYTHHAEICKSQITNCITIEPSAKIEYFSNFTITVRAEADTWKADSDPREFKPIHILKMARPQLRVTPSSDHVFVQWSRSSFSSKCGCEVKYSKAVDEGAPAVLRRKNLSERSDGEDTIEKWDSCSNYTFSVRCALDKAPWSNWSKNKTVLTKLNNRDFKLRLWRKVAEPEGNGVRKVHAMWTEIPSTCQDTFTYTIKVTPYKDAMVGVNYTDTSCGSSTCDLYVNQDAHRMRLTVLHNETLLVEDSVCVPAVGESESLPQVTDIQTSTLEGVLLVSWKASTEPVTGYMIDWTHDGKQYYWKESNCTNTTLPDHKQPYNITVTPLFDDETGHGTQALQICSRVGDPGNVTIQVQADAKSALVSWNVKSQEACSGVVVNYTVFYGIQNGPQLNIPVDGTEQFISLNNLNPDTYYSVQVNATALTGTATSRETFFQTKKFDAQLITAVGVCGSIVILLVLSLGVCCAVRWNKFREKPVPNPAFSSLALWPAPSPQEGTCPFQPFNNPTESVCDRVYTGESQRTLTSPLATGCDGIPACDQTGEYVDPATGPALVDPVEPVETQHLSSPDDSTALLPSENSPYRSQSSAENSASKFNIQCKRVPLKQIEKIAPVTVYVTLDMLQQGQGR